MELDNFVRQYLETALWSSTDGNDYPLDRDYDVANFAPEAVAIAVKDCKDFREANAADLADMEETQAAHDFWLTRNGHGAGFWDRGLGELGKRLTDAAHAYGSCDVYVGDDGKLYLS